MRFKLEPSQSKPGYWVCTDIENGIVCVFNDGKFNDTQNFTILNDIEKPNAQKIAGIINDMADWLRANHYDKLFFNIRTKFGQNLKRLRIEKGLTVRGLAELSGLSKSTIENIEQGRFSCSLDVQYNISIGLGVSIRDLFDFMF